MDPGHLTDIFATFNNTGRTRNLGAIAAEWNIINRFNPGTNWMLFDDWFVRANPVNSDTFVISKIEVINNNEIQLTYPTEAGFSYTIESSTDLNHWTELPNSPIHATTTNPETTHIDTGTTPTAPKRYYRILRNTP